MKLCIDSFKKMTKYVSKSDIFYLKTSAYVIVDACENCGKPFFARKKNSGIQKFCSLKCSQSGEFHPLFGKKIPKMTRKKMSENHADVSGKNNPMYGMRKEKAPNWKGGRQSRHKRDTKRYEYKCWRNGIFKRDNYTCQMCSKRGGNKEAHHIYTAHKHPEYVYKHWNGITLCNMCHRTVKGKEHKYAEEFLLKTLSFMHRKGSA